MATKPKRPQTPTIKQALKTVALLGPGPQPSAGDVKRVSPVMGNWQLVSSAMAELQADAQGLVTLRAMLAFEFGREGGPRDLIVERVIARHEQISRRMRLKAMASVIPGSYGLRKQA